MRGDKQKDVLFFRFDLRFDGTSSCRDKGNGCARDPGPNGILEGMDERKKDCGNDDNYDDG
jgi:hypothetical protein